MKVETVAFYTEVLGLEPGADGEVEAPNVTLSFWNPERDGEEFRPHVARRELESKGVEFRGETYDSGVCHMGFFTDPDGNTVILHRRYEPRG